MKIESQIEEFLKVLIGLPLCGAGRAGDLEWFHFGNRRSVVTTQQKLRVIGEYALHIQCTWRVLGPNGIFVGSQDKHYPVGELDAEPDEFDWECEGTNRCDERISLLLVERASSPLIVERVQANSGGAFCIVFSDNFFLEVFPDDSLADEHWRFFQPGQDDGEFILTGQELKTA